MSRTITLTFKREEEGSACYLAQQPNQDPWRLTLTPEALRELGEPDAVSVTIKALKRSGGGAVVLERHPPYDHVVRPI